MYATQTLATGTNVYCQYGKCLRSTMTISCILYRNPVVYDEILYFMTKYCILADCDITKWTSECGMDADCVKVVYKIIYLFICWRGEAEDRETHFITVERRENILRSGFNTSGNLIFPPLIIDKLYISVSLFKFPLLLH